MPLKPGATGKVTEQLKRKCNTLRHVIVYYDCRGMANYQTAFVGEPLTLPVSTFKVVYQARDVLALAFFRALGSPIEPAPFLSDKLDFRPQ